MNTTEQRAGAEALSQPLEVKIGRDTFMVSPPSIATLIRVSQLVSQLPDFDMSVEQVTRTSLRIARDCTVLGEVCAVLILGEKKSYRRIRLFGLEWFSWRKRIVKDLAQRLLYDLRPSELSELTQLLLDRMETGCFFGFTASLIEINLLRPKEVVTTASGQ